MAKIYNKKVAATQTVQQSSSATSSVLFTYNGFSSKEVKTNYKLYDIDLVKQDLINHFYIRKGEKLMNPDFGTVIWDLLFEPFTEEVKKFITQDVEQIINYDPRIAINSVSIDSTDMGIRIEADITYLPFNINERMTFDFDKENTIIN
jgi:phage baseplate assembly protein W